MLIKDFQVGQLQTNCYIVTDENTLNCVVIDPGAESNVMLNYIEENGLHLKYIFITHGHFDHTTAAEEMQKASGAPIYINEKDSSRTGSTEHYCFNITDDMDVRHYAEGDSIELDSLHFDVIETPGHSPGSVCLIIENAMFCGDTLFRDSCGRTDLQGGSMRTLMRSLKRLYELEGDYEVYPGHADSTTLERERRFNYFMQFATQN